LIVSELEKESMNMDYSEQVALKTDNSKEIFKLHFLDLRLLKKNARQPKGNNPSLVRRC
jgi:hypothetical protein